MQQQQKFTATLVTEADKAIVVEMRNETKLSEKQLMTLIIATAVANKQQILDTAKTIVEAEVSEREERRKANYELLKQKMKEAREAAKAEKAKRPAKSAKVTA